MLKDIKKTGSTDAKMIHVESQTNRKLPQHYNNNNNNNIAFFPKQVGVG